MVRHCADVTRLEEGDLDDDISAFVGCVVSQAEFVLVFVSLCM